MWSNLRRSATSGPLLQTVRFRSLRHAVHRRRGAMVVLVSRVHFKHPKALDFQGSARRAFGQIRLSIKEKHRGPHDASDGGVRRLRITRWTTRDQDDCYTKTLTTCGQRIQEAGVSLSGWSLTQRRSTVTADQPPKRRAIQLSSTVAITRSRRTINHFKNHTSAARCASRGYPPSSDRTSAAPST
ncbi:hypothetical protein TBK1r_65570 [Stieleria magnilauensis]|uniref:Uncharacterized protein n=1 Tax=Stieleria magnilauensis TaxID=2527963 RepID=A0ABX5Y3J3_9BACT|nr:hypothetical protein TBK1r_65570 [Planctomycetes bacterium TBK1r]